MTIDETANNVKDAIDEIMQVCNQIHDLSELILRKTVLNGDVIELSTENKQKIIQHYQPLKQKLQALANSLP